MVYCSSINSILMKDITKSQLGQACKEYGTDIVVFIYFFKHACR